MDALTHIQQYDRLIRDFTESYLVSVPFQFLRLVYLSSLRDLSSGRYEHAGLAAVYPESVIQQCLELCHGQIFERILEMPLASQEKDLRDSLSAMDGGLAISISNWQRLESYRFLIPAAVPDYLKELFCSNLRALLEVLQKGSTPAPETA
jgi:hypothetical protein